MHASKTDDDDGQISQSFHLFPSLQRISRQWIGIPPLFVRGKLSLLRMTIPALDML